MLIAKNLLTREASYKVFGTHTLKIDNKHALVRWPADGPPSA